MNMARLRTQFSLATTCLLLNSCAAPQDDPSKFINKWSDERLKHAEAAGPSSLIAGLEPDFDSFCTGGGAASSIQTMDPSDPRDMWACFEAISSLLVNALVIEAYGKAANYQIDYFKYKDYLNPPERETTRKFFLWAAKSCTPIYASVRAVYEPVSRWRIDIGTARVPSKSVAISAYFCGKFYGDQDTDYRTWLSGPDLIEIQKVYGPQYKQKISNFEAKIVAPLRERQNQIVLGEGSHEAKRADTQVLYSNALKACRLQKFEEEFCAFIGQLLEYELRP